MDEAEFIAALNRVPKADLHVHLEGSADCKLLAELCRKNGIDIEAPVAFGSSRPITVPKIRGGQWPELSGFRDFIGIYLKITEAICKADDLVMIGAEYLESCRRQNIVYSELYFSPSTFFALGRPLDPLYQGLIEIQRLAGLNSCAAPFIFDIVRNSRFDGLETVAYAEEARRQGLEVAAIGIAGMEDGNPASRYSPAIEAARKLGYKILIHSGELAQVEDCILSMKDALNLNPLRIGHGLAAAADPQLTKQILQRGTVIELCPWSNLLLQIRSETDHPAPAIISAGIRAVICSDDPGIFGKTLSDNYLLCRRLGVSDQALLELAANSLKISAEPA